MSGFTTLSITLTKPDLTTLTVTNPAVTVPNTDIETTDGLFLANKYTSYTFAPGDIDQVGDWSWRVTYTDAYQHLISDIAFFTIYE